MNSDRANSSSFGSDRNRVGVSLTLSEIDEVNEELLHSDGYLLASETAQLTSTRGRRLEEVFHF